MVQRVGVPDDLSPDDVPEAVLEALYDDLATPRAMAELFALAKAAETATSGAARRAAGRALVAAGRLMGVLYLDPVVWFEGRVDADTKLRIEGLLSERSAARVNKDWARADEIRAELTAMGVEVLDAAGGAATWRLKD